MQSRIKILLSYVWLIAILILLCSEAPAQDIAEKIKILEQLETRIDAKLKKLEEAERRLDARLPFTADSTAIDASAKGAVRAEEKTRSAAASVSAKESELWGGQITWRTGFTHFDSPVRSGAFTGSKNKQDGYMFGSTLDVPVIKDGYANTWSGYTTIDYIRTGGETRFAVTGDKGKQSFFRVIAAPKYRIDALGDVRPYIVPIGLSILVNSPPSQSANYLSLGGSTGGGVEYLLNRRVTLGLDFSYNFYNSNTNHLSLQPYIGFNY